jgi:hypothetical protein
VKALRWREDVYLFERTALEALRPAAASTQPETTAVDTASPKAPEPVARTDGALAADVFRLLKAGHDARDVVIELKLPPGVVGPLHAEYVALAPGLTIPAELAGQIAQHAGCANLTVEALTSLLAALLCDRAELRRFTYACCVCGKPVQAKTSLEWRYLAEQGEFADWHHAECRPVEDGDSQSGGGMT